MSLVNFRGFMNFQHLLRNLDLHCEISAISHQSSIFEYPNLGRPLVSCEVISVAGNSILGNIVLLMINRT
jgi:hypothetical protein